jgi:hypothetical protein
LIESISLPTSGLTLGFTISNSSHFSMQPPFSYMLS